MLFFRNRLARQNFLTLFLACMLGACSSNTQTSQQNFLGEVVSVEVLQENSGCAVDFQVVNPHTDELLFLQASLWLHRSNGDYTQLHIWEGEDLADLLGTSTFLVAGGVHAYTYDFSSYIAGITGEYSLDLQILVLKNQLPVLAQAQGFCQQE